MGKLAFAFLLLGGCSLTPEVYTMWRTHVCMDVIHTGNYPMSVCWEGYDQIDLRRQRFPAEMHDVYEYPQRHRYGRRRET